MADILPFEWDENKNAANQEKHFIRFERAIEIFEDANALEFLSLTSNEMRILRVGKTEIGVLISVIYTIRKKNIRIISARQARKEETKLYLEYVLSKKSTDEGNN